MVESISSLTGGRIVDANSYDCKNLKQTGRRMFTNSKGETCLLTKHQRFEGKGNDAYLNLYKQELDQFGIPEWKKAGTKVEEYGYIKEYSDKEPVQSKVATVIDKFDKEGKLVSTQKVGTDRVVKNNGGAYYQPTRRIELGAEGQKGSIKMTKYPDTFEIVKPVQVEVSNPKEFTPMLKRVFKLIAKSI